MATIRDPLRLVIGDKAAKRLDEAFGLRTVGDLLGHYPRRYASHGELTRMTGLRDGDHVTVMAEVAAVSSRPMRNRRGTIFEAIVTDGTGRLTLTFFGRGRQDWREEKLQPGMRGLFSGQVSSFRGKRQLAHPDYVLVGAGTTDARAAEYAAELIPIYPATGKLATWSIADSVRVVLDVLDVPADPLPADVRRQHQLIGYGDALRGIHRPVDWGDLGRAQQRLKWDEAFALQVGLAQRRRAAADYSAIPRPLVPDGLLDDFDAALPFELTVGQQLAGATIADEMARDHPMNRLLQGEVGSGKTVIAVRAMLQAVDAAGQAVLLAPTEVLAQQHYRSITSLLGPLGQAGQLGGAEHATRLTLLTGSQGAASRRRALLEAASGEAGIVIGTHALLEDRVQFADLGLVVIDEQHRFGVEQRDALRDKAGDGRPHVLVMTATPIPRTVAMTVFGDLDVSTLTELPAGRQPIATHVVPAAERPNYLVRTWERIREEVASGRQAYVVCPRIGDGQASPAAAPAAGAAAARADAARADAEEADAEEAEDLLQGEVDEGGPQRPPIAVLDLAAELAAGPLSGLRLGVMHGRLPPEEKDRVMLAFADGEVDVLVTTTVVEVGVDVPNATVMAIMDAERFGVSQLHQLRGRVGRGSHEGLCLLVTEVPRDAPARERLTAVAGTTDGFRLSRIDLHQRREGDVLGTVQAGRRSSLKILSVLDDEELIARARTAATALVDADPALAGHPALAAAVGALLENDRAEYLEKA
ncbi:MAG TPA: ATP-dependent DNA helicase RecG [Streptosporangiaceae bacterium]|nr:ATP-dependent DNA helicase RecG [Streptosporangiaceae bacterium]